MHMYNLIAYIDIYLKTSGDLRQYYEPDLDNDNNFIDFPPDDNNSISFKFKEKLTGQKDNDGTKDVDITVPLKYLSVSGETLKCL